MANYLGVDLTKEEILRKVGDLSQLAGIKPYVMKDGRMEGLKAFDVVTGSGLDFTVLSGKCLDISGAKYRGVNLSFTAKPGLVAPEYFDPHGDELKRNNQAGMMFTCGLSNVGSACTENGAEFSAHGRIGQTPAENVGVYEGWKGNEYCMEVSGEMRESAICGENLVLRRKISTGFGSRSIRVSDEVENQDFEDRPLMILYHFNFGYPLLDEGSELLIPALETLPRDAEAKKGIKNYQYCSSPVDGFTEQVFYHTVECDQSGTTCSAFVNMKLHLGVYIKYSASQLPRLMQWKSMSPGDYAMGLEPANCSVEGRVKERERGTLHFISPLEKKCFELEIGVLDGTDEINKFKNVVKELTGSH